MPHGKRHFWGRKEANHVLDGGIDAPTGRGNFWVEKKPAQDMTGHVRQSIYSKRLGRGQNRHGADADLGVLYTLRMRGSGPHPIHGFLAAFAFTSRTASRSVQSFCKAH